MTPQEIDAQIDALIPQLDAAKTDAERKPLLKRIEALERQKDEINRQATQGFVNQVNEGTAALNKERTKENADAVSALGRAARRGVDAARSGGKDGGTGGSGPA